MLKRVLIANRGEIACRIVRTARRMGVETVAVYSDADRGALHTRLADQAVHIGPSPATESYLSIDRILDAARATGADAIHPGYGFLAENADFADACAAAGFTFIGPTGAQMRKLGGKAAAKAVARAAGVPVVPGYDGDDLHPARLVREAGRIGYPVMIKAVAGGGGRGMRLVEREADFRAALESAEREALSAFADPRVLIEKVVQRPRHIEVQVFGDRHGNVVHMFERDCTLQRRNQKVIEEAPAPGMSAELRTKICGAAVALAKAVGYEGAGTVEFLVEGGTLGPEAPWYFIEMNTRLQVEHPVTEEITGLDLVEWQLRVAAGERLPLRQDAIMMSGHAIEARVCAEDPARGFMPSVGPIVHFAAPEADVPVRVETGIETGGAVSPFYDSMVVKLITKAPTRAEAINRLVRALKHTVVAGPVTNQGFLARLVADPEVGAARMDTGLIGRELERLAAGHLSPGALALGAATLLEHIADDAEEQAGYSWIGSPWAVRDGFGLGPPRRERRVLLVDGAPQTFEVSYPDGQPLASLAGALAPAAFAHERYTEHRISRGRLLVVADGMQTEIAVPTYDPDAVDDGHAGDHVRAPINGKVAKVFVRAGESVEKGARIAVVEAMKMEHVLHAARAGTIARLAVTEGQQVAQGALIASLTTEA